MIAVGKNTRHILENITLEQIKSMVSYERVMRILEEGGVTTDFRSGWLWLIGYNFYYDRRFF